jgi:hypothetical protein
MFFTTNFRLGWNCLTMGKKVYSDCPWSVCPLQNKHGNVSGGGKTFGEMTLIRMKLS